MKATIYHNPRCSKSRQTLALPNENNIDATIVEYLKTPPDKKTWRDLLEKLHIKPAALLRKKEKAFAESGPADKLDDNDAIIQAMVKQPVLIQRPVVVAGRQAVIGRPPGNVLNII